MADQKRWFKLWCSAPSDDDILSLPPELRWAWAALGCYTKEHGTKGEVKVSESNLVLAAQMGIPITLLKKTISMLPHMSIQESENRNGSFAVTWHNWRKYQEDSTAAERQQTLRSKKRGEENKKKKRTTPPPTPSAEYTETWLEEPWPSVRRFVAEHNTKTPDWWPQTQTLSDGVSEKIKSYLKQFPDQQWWAVVWGNLHRASPWLRTYHNRGLGWLLQRGQHDRIENCAKVHDGKYLG